MYVGTTFKAYPQTAKLMQPSMCAFHEPALLAQTATVFGTAAGDDWHDAAPDQSTPMRVGIVATVRQQLLRPALGATYLARYRMNAIHQGDELSDVVVVCGSQYGIQRNALRVREDVVLAARTTAIGWVRSSFFPAPTARIEELSTMAREKFSLSVPRSLASSTLCNRSHTRRRCQSLSRRQQVMPEPQPISLGSISQGMPDFSTNRMPVRTTRLHNGFRPVCRLRRRFFGNSGSISAHNSSSMIGCDIIPPISDVMPNRTKSFNRVQESFC